MTTYFDTKRFYLFPIGEIYHLLHRLESRHKSSRLTVKHIAVDTSAGSTDPRCYACLVQESLKVVLPILSNLKLQLHRRSRCADKLSKRDLDHFSSTVRQNVHATLVSLNACEHRAASCHVFELTCTWIAISKIVSKSKSVLLPSMKGSAALAASGHLSKRTSAHCNISGQNRSFLKTFGLYLGNKNLLQVGQFRLYTILASL